MKIPKVLFFGLIVLIISDIVQYLNSESTFQFKTEVLLEKEFLYNEIKAVDLINYIISKPSFWNQLEKEQGIINEILNQKELRERTRFKFISELKLIIESKQDKEDIVQHNKVISLIISRVNEILNSKILRESFTNNERIKIQKSKLEYLDSLYISLSKDSYRSTKEIYTLKMNDLEQKKAKVISELTSIELLNANSETNLNSFSPFIYTYREILSPQKADLFKRIFFHTAIIISFLIAWLLFNKLKS